MFLCFSSHSSKLTEVQARGGWNLQSVASWSEARVILWACNWRLKLGVGWQSYRTEPSTCGIWCFFWVVSELSWILQHPAGIYKLLIGMGKPPLPTLALISEHQKSWCGTTSWSDCHLMDWPTLIQDFFPPAFLSFCFCFFNNSWPIY